MRRWIRPAAVGTHDVSSFRAASRRALALRVLLGGGCRAPARGRGRERARPRSERPRPAAGRHDRRRRARPLALDRRRPVRCRAATLQTLIDADAPVGLVVFSDVAYELLPPGTPPQELRPIIRMLTPNAEGKVVNPWSDTFRAGTRISTALELAQDMLVADRVEGRLDPARQRPRDRSGRRSRHRQGPAQDPALGHAGAPARARAVERRPDALRRHPRPRRLHAARRRAGSRSRAAGRAAPAAADDAARARAALPRRAGRARALRRHGWRCPRRGRST